MWRPNWQRTKKPVGVFALLLGLIANLKGIGVLSLPSNPTEWQERLQTYWSRTHSPILGLAFLFVGLAFLCGERLWLWGRVHVPWYRGVKEKPQPLLLPPLPPPVPISQPDIRGEILDVIVDKKDVMAVLAGLNMGVYILVMLRLTNRGPIGVSITDWSLTMQIGQHSCAAIKIQGSSQRIRRNDGKEEAIDWLDKRDKEQKLEYGGSMTGWILFKSRQISNNEDYVRGARLCVTITDALGNAHPIVREPVPFQETGRIVCSRY